MRALRKQFSIDRLCRRLLGKDKEELRQERAKLEADKLAFERQKLEAEEEARRRKSAARAACGGRQAVLGRKRKITPPPEFETAPLGAVRGRGDAEIAGPGSPIKSRANDLYRNLTAMTQMKNLNGYKRCILRDAPV